MGLVVHSSEYSDDKWNLVLSHIFWGNDLTEAAGNAKAHLLTDFFYTSSFVGKMKWGKGSLVLRVEVELYGGGEADTELEATVHELTVRADRVHDAEVQVGYEELISEVVKMKIK